MHAFKKLFIERNTKRAIKKSTVSRDNISFKKAQSIGIIYSWEGKRKAEIINEFAKEMDMSGKKVQILCYSRVDLKIVPVEVDFFSEKDFDNFGNLKSEKLKNFKNLRFDFISSGYTSKCIY